MPAASVAVSALRYSPAHRPDHQDEDHDRNPEHQPVQALNAGRLRTGCIECRLESGLGQRPEAEVRSLRLHSFRPMRLLLWRVLDGGLCGIHFVAPPGRNIFRQLTAQRTHVRDDLPDLLIGNLAAK